MNQATFIVLPPLTKNNSIICGKNLDVNGGEIAYYPANSQSNGNCDSVDAEPSVGILMNGNCGANEKNVTILTIFSERKCGKCFKDSDLCRLGLERSDSAEVAVKIITNLVDKHNPGTTDLSSKYGFLICDSKKAYILNIVGKVWAAEELTGGFRAIGSGLTVSTKIDMKSDNLEEKLKDLDLQDGGVNFSKAFGSNMFVAWPDENDITSGSFSSESMFNILRSFNSEQSGTSMVSVLKDGGLSIHWLTGTTNVCESVFKPFTFTSNVRISPLTSLDEGETETALQKLHSNRKWEQVGDLLKSLEKSCVDEVDGFIDDAPTPELDELLKDCVEAEVKFYR